MRRTASKAGGVMERQAWASCVDEKLAKGGETVEWCVQLLREESKEAIRSPESLKVSGSMGDYMA